MRSVTTGAARTGRLGMHMRCQAVRRYRYIKPKMHRQRRKCSHPRRKICNSLTIRHNVNVLYLLKYIRTLSEWWRANRAPHSEWPREPPGKVTNARNGQSEMIVMESSETLIVTPSGWLCLKSPWRIVAAQIGALCVQCGQRIGGWGRNKALMHVHMYCCVHAGLQIDSWWQHWAKKQHGTCRKRTTWQTQE